MAWQVAVVLDRGESIETLHANLYILLGQMPVWAVASPARVPGAMELREQWDKCWYPEPALTLVRPDTGDPDAKIVDLIPTIQEHHPRISAVRLFGISASTELAESLLSLGMSPILGASWDGIGFARPLSQIADVPVIRLNAANWISSDDFFSAFFRAVGAPNWHGRNFDALNDSIGDGGINRIEVPYRLVVQNLRAANQETKKLMSDFAALIEHLQTNGCPVELQAED
ncbi:MAG: barstar family protein [Terracidiphilus sp.]